METTEKMANTTEKKKLFFGYLILEHKKISGRKAVYGRTENKTRFRTSMNYSILLSYCRSKYNILS